MDRMLGAFALLSCLLAAAPAAALDDDSSHPHDHAAHVHDEGFSGRADGLPPVGVMGGHMHEAGGWMLSYRYLRMRMDGNRDGSHPVGAESLLMPRGPYMTAPLDMDMQVHLFGAMWAPTDWLTLTSMMPWVQLRMDHLSSAGTTFRTHSEGAGDLRLGGLVRLFEDEMHHVHLNAGASFPTGRIRHKDTIPQMGGPAHVTLPFPMQIGSGTFDLLPGLSYLGHAQRLSWGGQALGTIRLDENDAGWRAGNRVDLSAWLAFPWTRWLSSSARVAYLYWGNTSGDEDRPPTPEMIPTADPERRGGHRIDLLGGVNWIVPLGPLGRQRLAAEAGFPVYQWLKGPQLETDWRVTVGWQKSF